jgi:peptidoglycan hydrolase-like protein with peptidoglycan-binding domain
MEPLAFELLPLGERFVAGGEAEDEEDERGRVTRAGMPRARPRPRPAPPRPGPRPAPRAAPRQPPRRRPPPLGWPVAWPPGGGYFSPLPAYPAAPPAPAPACDCAAPAGPDIAEPAAADDVSDAAELFEFAAFEFEAPAATPVLRRGSRGSAVSDLQRRLAAAGHSPGAVDGIFGSLTDGAVRRFQQARRLTVDGVVGPMTWGVLLGGGTRPSPAPAPVPTPGPGGTAPRWVLPEAVRLAGEAQHVRYDSPPPWTGNPGNCSGNFTAGAQTLRAHIQANFAGVTSIGGYSCRQNTANTAETSVHGVGRALDIMITPIAGQANAAAGDRIANWLVNNAQAIGVQYVIWNRVRWSGSAGGRKDATYGGPNPHIDHIHAEINLDAAARRTPWFVGR